MNFQFTFKSLYFTCHTPTMAFAMRMSRMTKGSTNAVMESSSSKNASTFTRENFIITELQLVVKTDGGDQSALKGK